MIIPKTQMQKIAEEVGSTIQKNVNIMDKTGHIIASTDPERIGMLHIGMAEMLRQNLPELIIENDSQGMKEGINLPLVIKDEVIGGVGITGRLSEVRLLGVVIKKMTEILILDQFKSSQKKALEELERSFFIELLFGNDKDDNDFQGGFMHIDITTPKIVSVTELSSDTQEDKQPDIDYLLSKLKKGFPADKQAWAIRIGSKIIAIHNSDNENAVASALESLLVKFSDLNSSTF